MKRNVLFALCTLGFLFFLSSCKKINAPTELGDDLLPAVDNVNTFDTTLEVLASYRTYPEFDTTGPNDNLALGQISDPVFGSTRADMYFNLSSSAYGSSPFINKATVTIDSVVLSLAYVGVYGDSTMPLNVAVSEIANDTTSFNDTRLYRYEHPGFSTTGPVLGTKMFSASGFKDSTTIARIGDTTRVANVLRIHLDNSLGVRLSQFDTTGNGPYKSDSLFRLIFRGLAVKTISANGPGALTYFDPSATNSALYVYYKSKKTDGTDTSGTATFIHGSYLGTYANNYGVANSIVRTPGIDYLKNMDVASTDKLYIQSSPTGSYVGMSIPGLTNFPNKVIHRAELIAYRLPSALDNFLTPPSRLLLDRQDAAGVAHLFDNDIQFNSDRSVFFGLFGGTLGTGGSYRFNITRYVQGIVTRKEHNDSLRLYAPLRSKLYSTAYGAKIPVPVISNIAAGRVVIAGNNYPTDPARRLRLRIVYSNL